MTDFVVYSEMFPDEDVFSTSSPDRGNAVMENYEKYIKKLSYKDFRFYRRFIANLFLSFWHELLSTDARDKVLFEFGVKVVISVTIPSLWEGVDLNNKKRFLSRLAMLQRMSETNLMSYLSKPIKEQMNPGLTDYALMFAGLFGTI